MTALPEHALILDFDGVIADTEPLHFQSWNVVFEQNYGIQKSGTHESLVGLTLDEIYQLWMGERTPLTHTQKEELLILKNEAYFTLVRETLVAMPGCKDLIWKAHTSGWYVAIVSRARRLRLYKNLELIGMPALFDVVLGSENCVDPHTNRKIHARAAQMVNVEPTHCIVIEDSASGVADAVACGIGCVIGLTTSLDSATLLAAGAHHIIHHLNEVSLEIHSRS